MRGSRGLLAAILIAGGVGTISQVVLVRELLVTFSGNELSLGVVLALFLAFEAVGSLLARRIPGQVVFFSLFSLGIAVLLPGAIFFARTARSALHLTSGQAIGLPAMFFIAGLTLVGVSLFHGALFPLSVRLTGDLRDANRDDSAPAHIAQIYVTEITGSILGGLMLSLFLLGRMDSFAVALIAAGLNAAALLSLALSRQNWWGAGASALLGLGTIAAGFLGLPQSLQQVASARQFPGSDVFYQHDSHYGRITVLLRSGQYTVLLDGLPAATLPVPDYAFAEDFVHLPMQFVRAPSPDTARRVLLAGTGFNGVLAELLKYPAISIDYCELDPEVIAAVRRIALPSVAAQLNSPDVSVKTTDVRFFLRRQSEHAQTTERYDLILINYSDPATLQLNRYYTVEFLRLVRNRLRPDGVAAFTAPGSESYLTPELRELNRLLWNTARKVFPAVRVIAGDVNVFLAGENERQLMLSAEEIAARFARAHIATRLITPQYLVRRFAPLVEARFHASIAGAPTVNQDLNPAAVSAALAHRLSLSGATGSWSGRRILWGVVILTVIGAGAVLLRRTLTQAVLAGAVLTTGFAGAAISLVLLLLYQIGFSSVYFNLVVLTTAFMLGTALGGAIAGQAASRRQLVFAELGLGASALILVLIARSNLPPAVYFFFSIIAGTLLGFEFPLASRLWGERSAHSAAGSLYGADLLGGFAGYALVPVLLVPAIGIVRTAAVVVVLKLISALLLVWLARPRRSC